jgi:hypothetical protein
MHEQLTRRRTSLALLCLTSLWLAAATNAQAQAPAQAPPAQQAPAPAPAAPTPAYPAAQPAPAYPQQAYPQQAYPQQAYPQQAYPQQAYPQQAYPQQAYPQQAYPQPPRRARAKRGMLAAGIAVLSASYAVALVTGAVLIDTQCCRDVGAMMMIPVVGPYIAVGVADDVRSPLVLLGTVEVLGLGLLIGGIVRYTRSKHAAEEQGYYTWKLPQDRSLGVALSSSPALTGPQLRLRF